MKRVLTFLLTMVLAFSAVQARPVKGVVKGGLWPLSKVVVTDGVSFTKTNCLGRFKLDLADDAHFVYIVVPQGYMADYSSGNPEFYKKAEGVDKFKFKLKKTSKSTDYTLFSISDPQMRDEEHFEEFKKAPLPDILHQAEKYSEIGTTVIVTVGDLGWDALQYQKIYKECIKATGVPCFVTIGNHDYDENAPEGPETYKEYEDNFGPRNWATWIGNDLLIGLNTIQYKAKLKYSAGYGEAELDFMKNLLGFIPEDTHIFLAQHAPVFERDYFGEPIGFIDNADKMIEILGNRKVDIISGHSHIMNNNVIAENIIDHNAPSLCGCFWDVNWCNDGSPRGFEIFTKRDGELSWFFHPTDYPEDMIATLAMKGEGIYYPECFVLNVWDYDPQWEIRWWEDGVEGEKAEMIEDCDPIYYEKIKAVYGDKIPGWKRPRDNNHYFAINPSPSAKVLKVEVKSRFGKVWQKEINL